MKYRVAVVISNGNVIGENFNTRDEVDEFLIKIDDESGLKRFRVIDFKTKELLETETGRKDKK